MVLDRQVEQVGHLLLDARIEVAATEGLVNRAHRALERFVLLAGEQGAAAELVAQHLQRRHRILIGRAERLLGGSGRHLQLLIIVAVERVEAVGVVRNHAQQSDRLGFRNLLRSQDMGEQTDGLFQLLQLLGFRLVIDGITLYKVLFQHLVRSDAELRAARRLDTVADKDNHVKVVDILYTANRARTLLANL